MSDIVEIMARAIYDADPQPTQAWLNGADGPPSLSWEDASEEWRGASRETARATHTALQKAGWMVTPAWRPIASAPKDGTSILAWCETYPAVLSWQYLDPNHACWCGDVVKEPTHWMPLPAPPEAKAADVAGNVRAGSEAEPTAEMIEAREKEREAREAQEKAAYLALPAIKRIERWHAATRFLHIGESFALLGQALNQWAVEQQQGCSRKEAMSDIVEAIKRALEPYLFHAYRAEAADAAIAAMRNALKEAGYVVVKKESKEE